MIVSSSRGATSVVRATGIVHPCDTDALYPLVKRLQGNISFSVEGRGETRNFGGFHRFVGVSQPRRRRTDENENDET